MWCLGVETENFGSFEEGQGAARLGAELPPCNL